MVRSNGGFSRAVLWSGFTPSTVEWREISVAECGDDLQPSIFVRMEIVVCVMIALKTVKKNTMNKVKGSVLLSHQQVYRNWHTLTWGSMNIRLFIIIWCYEHHKMLFSQSQLAVCDSYAFKRFQVVNRIQKWTLK